MSYNNNNINPYLESGKNSQNSSSQTLDPKKLSTEKFEHNATPNYFISRPSSPLPKRRQQLAPALKTDVLQNSPTNNNGNMPSSAGSELDTDDDIINHYINSPEQFSGRMSPLEYSFKATNLSNKKSDKRLSQLKTETTDAAIVKEFAITSPDKLTMIPPKISSNESPGRDIGDKRMLSTASNPISVSSEISLQNETPHLSSSELQLSENFKKEQDEWAEKGAAKIVQEVKDDQTGEVFKKLVSRGIKDFKFGNEIGDGSFSRVLLATSVHDVNEKYAIKILSKSYLVKQNKVKYVNIEKTALQRLHKLPTVVKMFFTFQDQNSLYFVLEYAPNGDFLSIMKKYGSLSEECVRYYSAQIIDAINDLHVNGIIHRDIKPENILLDKDKKIKLTDFGTAKILEKGGSNNKYDLLTRSKSFVGTAEYVSPELLNDSYTDYKCDIWAFGCILFQMVAGKPPFKASNEYLTFQKVQKIQYAFTAGFPTIIRDLVKRILIKQPENRLEIVDIKNHLFYKDIDFNSIWQESPPLIQPFKMNAKSMAPIPELSNQPLPGPQKMLKRSAGPPLYTNTSSISSDSSKSKASPSTPTKPSTSSKKNSLDPRTQDILDQANKKVQQRKLQKMSSQKTVLKKNGNESKNAAMAAMATLNNKPGISSQNSSSEKRVGRKTQTGSTKAGSPSTASFNNGNTKKYGNNSKSDSLSNNIIKAITPYLLNDEKVMKTDVVDCINTPTTTLNKLLVQKRTTLKDLPLFESLPHYNTDNSYPAHKSINKPLIVFDIPDNNLLDPLFWTQDANTPLVLLKNSDYKEKQYPLDVSHYESKMCCITNLGRMLLFVKGETNYTYYLQFILELNHKNTYLREITPSKHELTTKYQFVFSDQENSSILFSIPQSDCISWMNCMKRCLSYETSKKVTTPNPMTNNGGKERMFDNFVSMRENQRSMRQKPNKPESSVNLINGLPSFANNPEERSNNTVVTDDTDSPASPNTNKLLSVKKFLTRKQ